MTRAGAALITIIKINGARIPCVCSCVLELEMCERRDEAEDCRKACIYNAQEELGLRLKDKQLESVHRFCCGNDVFVSIPTGYVKSIIYAILPYVYDKMTCKF